MVPFRSLTALTNMRTIRYAACLLLSLVACDKSSVLHNTVDGATGGPDGTGSGNRTCAGWVFPLNETTGSEPSWVTDSCPSGGCPGGTVCMYAGVTDSVFQLGCAPVQSSCSGTPDCTCMGCACGSGASCRAMAPSGDMVCDTGTLSTRKAKTDIAYVTAGERSALARDALAIPLARYRYKTEAKDARRRLGFIIEDQPDPSPAVLADRNHVDEYGYTSMLLATVQEQAKQIADLRERVEQLERARGTITR